MPQTNGITDTIEVNIWWDEAEGTIHLAGKDRFITTISDDPESERRHRHLFMHLAKVLKDAGAPHPP